MNSAGSRVSNPFLRDGLLCIICIGIILALSGLIFAFSLASAFSASSHGNNTDVDNAPGTNNDPLLVPPINPQRSPKTGSSPRMGSSPRVGSSWATEEEPEEDPPRIGSSPAIEEEPEENLATEEEPSVAEKPETEVSPVVEEK
jgi:hypothetical protein